MVDNRNGSTSDAVITEYDKATNVGKTVKGFRAEPLQQEDQEATDCLVHRMLDHQEDKVKPSISVTREGTVDLHESKR